MTNEQFWKKLEDLTRESDDQRKTIMACQLLADAYKQDLSVIALCTYTKINGGLFAKQGYIEIPSGRLLICYTSEKRAQQDHWNIPTEWFEVSLRDVLNNMFNKDVIAGIMFNPHDQGMIGIPKFVMELFLPGNHPKPEGFVDAGR